MDDLISRKQAIDALKEKVFHNLSDEFYGAMQVLDELPSAQPKPCEDAVSREAVLSMIDTYMNKSVELHYLPTSDGIKKLISILPIVTPKLRKETSDLISRQQAIDALRGYLVEKRCPDDGTLTCRLIENEVINKLPTIQSEQRWIPVSERLPEEGKVVLTQAKFKDDVKMAVSSRIDYNYWTTWGTRDINIIAWIPLPEPYKGEQE